MKKYHQKKDGLSISCIRAIVGHAPGAATGTETPTFAAARRDMLGMAGLAAHPQEPVIEAPAFEVFIELPLDIPRQCASLSRQMRLEREVVFFDELIQEGGLPSTANVTSIERPTNACSEASRITVVSPCVAPKTP